jgi:uncharacterized membrane protein YsdA (DUF1294 family)
MLDPQNFWKLVLVVYGLASLASFALMGWDKRAASRERRRVSERLLHGLELVGGWPGALLGMAVWRHKYRKLSFVAVTVVIVLLHALMWLWLLGAFG